MPALLSKGSQIAQYLLGYLTLDESRRIEEEMLFDHNLSREVETAEEELIAAYVVGRMQTEDRLKFETNFLSSNERARKLKFAKAWFENGESACPDLTSPLHRYVLGDMTQDEEVEVEEKLSFDKNYRGQLESAEDELLLAYFQETLPDRERELFEANYLVSEGIVRKLRFAHIMREYVKRASIATSQTAK
jgi:anti-sigma-K factor RskA